MKIILFGATGMVGQCVLTECLKSPIIKDILIIGRKSCGIKDDKIKEIIHNDFLDYSNIESELKGYDACFYCLGVSSSGMSKDKYYDITYNYTVAVAEVLIKQNPAMRFSFISGAGTDEKEKSILNWARVKGKAENVLRKYQFKSLSLFRPSYIKALEGVKPTYTMYIYFDWLLYPILKTFFPKTTVTSEELGKAMINSVFQTEEVRIIESPDIKKLADLG
ncbi:MAG: NAD(P)H-binding protein [Bacteroidales bacterium]|nr:NAD(P)H-binding protein [Bacteroidales bacterium]